MLAFKKHGYTLHDLRILQHSLSKMVTEMQCCGLCEKCFHSTVCNDVNNLLKYVTTVYNIERQKIGLDALEKN